MDYQRYEELQRGLRMIQEEFRRCFPLHPRLYSQIILTPDANAPLSNEAWDAFRDANQHHFYSDGDEWEEWEVSPDRTVCSRLHGAGNRGAVGAFRRTAESGYDVLLELQFLREDGNTPLDEFRLVLPQFVGATGWRPADAMFAWLTVVFETAFACQTPFLHADHGLWGHPDETRRIETQVHKAVATRLDWEVAHARVWEEAEEQIVNVGDNCPTFPAHPPVQTLRYDVFRSSVEAINVWLNSDRTARVAVEDEPPIWLPPSTGPSDVKDDECLREDVDQEAAPAEAEKVTLVWDKDLGTLTVGDIIVKTYSREAPKAWKILDEFQKEDWPLRIDDPFGGNAHALRATVYDINKSLDVQGVICFGTRAKGVTRELIQQP